MYGCGLTASPLGIFIKEYLMIKLMTKIKQHNIHILTILVLFAIIPLIFIEADFYETYYLTIKYLAIPILIIIFFFGIKYKEVFFYLDKSNKRMFGTLFGISSMLLLFLGPYLLIINTLIPPQENVLIAGEIIDKTEQKGSRLYSDKRYLIIKSDNKEIKWRVSKIVFDSVSVGSYYYDIFTKGSLGISYKRKYFNN